MIRELWALGLDVEHVTDSAHLVRFSGRWVWFVERERDVLVEAFVLHVLPEADAARLHAHLLFRNRDLRRVHYAVDEVGDVFLVGSCTGDLDGLLGELHGVLSEDLVRVAYGDDVPDKALLDGAGRRMAGRTPVRDVRR